MSADAARRAERLQRSLDELTAAPHVAGCALLTAEGLIVGHALPDDWLVHVGSATGACWTGAQRLTLGVGLGTDLTEILLTTERGTVVLRPVGDHHVLLVLAAAGATLGLVRVSAEHATRAIREGLTRR